MKIGDRLLCKKDVEDEFWGEYGNNICDKDNFYKIKNIVVPDHVGHSYAVIQSSQDYKFWFVEGVNLYIWDYFYTKKEMRKMKLDKLNF